MKPFFPNPAFAWAFYAALIALLAVAAVIDWRRAVVPKWLSLTTLTLGVVCNMVRGAWMGSQSPGNWSPGPHWGDGHDGMGLGTADGFLFALAGFAASFGVLFLMWIVGACAGGDVKLFAATGAWIGPYIFLWVLVLSTIILIVLLCARLAAMFAFRSLKAAPPAAVDKKLRPPVSSDARLPRDPRLARAMTFSLPLALATALALLWFFRVDLELRPSAERASAPVAPAGVSSWPI